MNIFITSDQLTFRRLALLEMLTDPQLVKNAPEFSDVLNSYKHHWRQAGEFISTFRGFRSSGMLHRADRLLITDVSGQRIGQIVKGQSAQVSDSVTLANKTDRYLTTDLPCVTSQKSEDLKLHRRSCYSLFLSRLC
jgi:hypothetical protein